MKLFFTNFIKTFFADDFEEFLRISKNKIPTFIENGYFRIKPIKKNPTNLNLFELKIHIKKEFRLSFTKNQDEIIIFFASKTLIKSKFEEELNKFISKNKEFLLGKTPFD